MKKLIYILAVFSIVFLLSTSDKSSAKLISDTEMQMVTNLADLPKHVQKKISHHLQTDEYTVTSCNKNLPSGETGIYQALNHSQNFRSYFSDEGVNLLSNNGTTPSWNLRMSLSAYGTENTLTSIQPVKPGDISVSGNRIEYRRNGFTEWYVNDEQGLEQGFTIDHPVAKGDGTKLVLVLALHDEGGIVPTIARKSDEIVFYDGVGGDALRYGGLLTKDAQGRILPGELILVEAVDQNNKNEIRIMVDAKDASYPITIDPLFSQETKIIASDGAANDYFGYSVSISGDTIVVGAPNDDDVVDSSGSAYIFSKDQGGADNWGEVQKLTASTAGLQNKFGISVSISGDTAVVGASGYLASSDKLGKAYIFYRNQGGADNWGEVQKLTASDGEAGDEFGDSVAISGDTVVVLHFPPSCRPLPGP